MPVAATMVDVRPAKSPEAELLKSPDWIPPTRSPAIKHLVLILQDGRSFDSYFGHIAKYAASIGLNMDVEAAPEDASNPEDVDVPDSPTHPWQHACRPTRTPPTRPTPLRSA